MGKILEDMTKTSREKIEKYHKEPPEPVKGEEEEDEGPLTLEEVREVGYWLFIFEAARETHMFQGVTNDRVLMYEKQEQKKEYFSKMKHTAGDFNRWITRFEKIRLRRAKLLESSSRTRRRSYTS